MKSKKDHLKNKTLAAVNNEDQKKISAVLSESKRKKKKRKKFIKNIQANKKSILKGLQQDSNKAMVLAELSRDDKFVKNSKGTKPTVDNKMTAKNSKKQVDIVVEKAKEDSKEMVMSEKKRLKKLLWKQKQMAKKLARKGLVNKHENKQLAQKVLETKVALPKTAQEAAANWKKLQETISAQSSRKRKIPASKIRNPKYRKVEDWQEKNKTCDNQAGSPDIWFDDVDELLLERTPASMETRDEHVAESGPEKEANPLVKPGAFKGVTKVVCMDCEMVGVGDGSDSMLARVSVVNQYGEPIYDKFVKPKEEVVDYRTYVSGVRPQDLKNAEEFEQVQKDVADILKGKILVGHAVKNDLKVLYLSHPKKRVRDTSLYKPFRQLSGGRTPSLKKLSDRILQVKVQEGEHNSVQDAQATMRLYTMYRKQWESEIIKKKKDRKAKKRKT